MGCNLQSWIWLIKNNRFCLTKGTLNDPSVLSTAMDIPDAASPTITGEGCLITFAHPDPLAFSGCPLTRRSEFFIDTGMSSQLSRMWYPSVRFGNRSCLWFISATAKVIVRIHLRARGLKLQGTQKSNWSKSSFITQIYK